MMNKKGFVFVETIVVCAVLSISLVTVYAAFAMLVKNQKTRSNYDQAVYNYRSYYLVKYLNVITCDQEVSIDDDEIKNSLDITKAICVSADKLNDYKDDITNWYYGHFHQSNTQTVGNICFRLLNIGEICRL